MQIDINLKDKCGSCRYFEKSIYKKVGSVTALNAKEHFIIVGEVRKNALTMRFWEATMPKTKRIGQKPNANEAQLREAARRGMDRTMVFCLTALADKMGFEQEQLVQFIHSVADVADSVVKGYVNYDQLHKVLVDEQGLEW